MSNNASNFVKLKIYVFLNKIVKPVTKDYLACDTCLGAGVFVIVVSARIIVMALMSVVTKRNTKPHVYVQPMYSALCNGENVLHNPSVTERCLALQNTCASQHNADAGRAEFVRP